MSDAPPPPPDAPPSPPPARARRRLGWRKRLGFLATLVLIAAVAAELAARAAGFPRGLVKGTQALWARDDQRALGPFAPGARATVAWPPEVEYTIEVNALGLRGPPPAAGRPVVLCVGDSTTFGACVAEADTYPALLEPRLGPVAVVNAGCPRWTITDEDEFVARALPALAPRVVVLLFCGNDLFELDKAPSAERVARERRDVSAMFALPEALVYGTLLARRAWLRSRGQWPLEMRPDQGRTGDWGQAAWPRWAEVLARLQARCREAGAPLVVAAFPGFAEVVDPAPCMIEATLPDLVRAVGATYVDLYGPFRASPAGRFLLPHDPHASRSGNDLIAATIAPVVSALLDDGGAR